MIDYTRARIQHPDGIVSPGRFVFNPNGDGPGLGTAAVWTETRRPHYTATRVLFATGTFTPHPKPRMPGKFVTTEGQEWTVTQLASGCGCNKARSVIGSFTLDQLTDPEVSSV